MVERTVEVFTSGCFLCEDTVKLVNELACPSCEVKVYNLAEPCESRECIDKAKQYGVSSIPTVVVDGTIVECCRRGTPNKAALVSAGIGAA